MSSSFCIGNVEVLRQNLTDMLRPRLRDITIINTKNTSGNCSCEVEYTASYNGYGIFTYEQITGHVVNLVGALDICDSINISVSSRK
jgi:hypothetical protein